MNQKTYPWGLVTALLIILWPLGLYMLIRNMSQTKGDFSQLGRAMKSLSIFVLFLTPVMLVMSLSGQLQFDDGRSAAPFGAVCALILAAGGVLLMNTSKKYMHRGARYEYYIDLLYREKSVDINLIADDLRRSVKDVMADLRLMLQNRLIHNGFLDVQNKRLILSEEQRQVKTVICPNCGGTNKIAEGQHACCAYCDSALDV